MHLLPARLKGSGCEHAPTAQFVQNTTPQTTHSKQSNTQHRPYNIRSTMLNLLDQVCHQPFNNDNNNSNTQHTTHTTNHTPHNAHHTTHNTQQTPQNKQQATNNHTTTTTFANRGTDQQVPDIEDFTCLTLYSM
jgi:hypothetical protein